jgi:hypothetical protein
MDLGAVFLLLALLLGVGLFLAAPLLGGSRNRAPLDMREASSLMAERDRVINALQELDFDFKLGKIPEADYPVQRTSLLEQGSAILRKLDELAPAAAEDTGSDPGTRIERAAAASGGDSARASRPLDDDRIESMLAARRAARRAEGAGFCPRCGKPVLTTDQFCPNCGKALEKV